MRLWWVSMSLFMELEGELGVVILSCCSSSAGTTTSSGAATPALAAVCTRSEVISSRIAPTSTLLGQNTNPMFPWTSRDDDVIGG